MTKNISTDNKPNTPNNQIIVLPWQPKVVVEICQ